MRGSRRLAAAAILIPLLACGREGDRGVPDGEARPAGEAAAPVEPEAAFGEAPEPLDSAAVARALAEDEALDAANRATYEQRRRSMGGYAECMAQARDLPPQTRARIEEACARLRGQP